MISILDCQMGNIGSVVNIIKHIGHPVQVISTKEEVLQAEKIIFPGVGHWDNGVRKLNESGLKSALLEAVNERKTPLMGICLGMQLLFKTSDEGDKEGLGIVPGHVKKFDFRGLSTELLTGAGRLRIPHMGWNVVMPCREKEVLWTGLQELDDETRFYFVHSFHASDVPEEYQLLTCHYGRDFVCAVNKDNVWGFQFHPEKSHKFGMQLLKNFAERI
ncbi:imidazole glycerol phosphate synthase subunit HisH [Vibrio metschnikovii]|uniref:imidazole glycerol phosphate synthase subunit HisH n=1 Tax=Vibrio metschnikovii TaxID=28172 RepID=UPI001C2FE7B3|nr:imidazole glycerol phosphate synthase subunit HisH [Vibrio metschnikovii]EKO3781213.1 imidazole glycerol phosphate synthase subunit HisH [Vibrio metschnikovii]EKO3888052.1 imidazole glycerol phosphate synthase subunit HisH [Vibrio metschnikovii]EKO3937111.1 imidazole glycerol phosphate synthase subunit HisH [Vibrio metschnikovii]